MHVASLAAAALLALIPSAVAVGSAAVSNKCTHNICVYIIQAGTGAITGMRTLAPNQNTTFAYPAAGAPGQQLQVSPTCQSTNVVYYEYSQGGSNVYYDVNVGGTSNPFSIKGLSVTGSTTQCPKIDCKPNSVSCFNAPGGNQQHQVKACNSANSITFDACVS